MKKIIIIMLCLFLFGCGGKKSIYKNIIDNVEKAYDMASLNGTPSLEEVRNSFSMNDANWLADQIISDKSAVCDLKIDNNYLKVICPGVESSKEMLLSR